MQAPPKKPSKRPPPPPIPPSKRNVLNVRRPTSGRILRYTYTTEDHPVHGKVGTSRPCMVVDARSAEGSDDEVFDVVVFTAGLLDFSQGRTGPMGTISKTGVRLVDEGAPGCIHWPPEMADRR